MINSIWSSPEAEAWARGFRYHDYLHIHQQMGVEAKTFSEEGYRAICAVFEDEMVRDIG